MKKFFNFFATCLLITSCLSCGAKNEDNNSTESNNDLVMAALKENFKPSFFKKYLEEQDFAMGPATIKVAEQNCDISWASNSERITLIRDVASNYETTFSGGRVFSGEDYYRGHVESFPNEEEDISSTFSFNFRGTNYEFNVDYSLCSQESYYFHTEMNDWKHWNETTIKFSKSVKDPHDSYGQSFYHLTVDAEWNLETNMVKIKVRHLRLDYVSNYFFDYNVNNQMLTYHDNYKHKDFNLALNRTYTRKEYDAMLNEDHVLRIEFIDYVRFVLRDINKYLIHLGKENLCCVEEATITGVRLFNSK